MNFNDKIQKLDEFMTKIQANAYIQAISDGMMALLPIMIIGSIATLLGQISISSYEQFITVTGIKASLKIVSTVTMNFMALYATFLIGYKLARKFNIDGLLAGVFSVMSFFIVTPLLTLEQSVAIDISYLGAKGLFVGMLVAILATRMYVFFIQKKITIKMPDTVPPVVSISFSSLIPGISIAALFIVVNYLVGLTSYGNAHNLISTLIQRPLQSMGSNIFTVLILVAMMEFLWFFGIHGSNVINPILLTVFYSMDLANMEALQAGVAMTNVITVSFIQNWKGPRNLALAILLTFKAKSKHLKSVGQLGIVPAFFGISEPLKFGLPMILNPIIGIPMVLTPVVSILLAYWATILGFIPIANGATIPSGTPELLRPLFICGVRGVIFGLILLVVCMIIYYPFVMMFDKKKLQEEKEMLDNLEKE